MGRYTPKGITLLPHADLEVRANVEFWLSVFSQHRLDVLRLGDHNHAARRNDEAALFVLFRIEADPDALGNRHALVDDRPADFRVAGRCSPAKR